MSTAAHLAPGPDDASRPRPGAGPLAGLDSRTQVYAGIGGLPPQLHFAATDMPDIRDRCPWQLDTQTFGTSWEGPERARRSAQGEAVERFCGTCPPSPENLRYGTYAQLTRSGVRAVDPHDLVLYSPRQYASAGFPFQRFDRDAPAHWVVGRSAVDDEPVLVPAFLVYSAWPQMPRPNPEPLYAFPAISGIAAGPTAGAAVHSALEEVVERDTVAVWWANAHPLPALPVDQSLEALTRGGSREFETRLVLIDNPFSLPVVAAGVRSVAEGWLSYGCAARDDVGQAAAKALAEAYTLQLTCLTLDNPATQPASPGRPSALKSWRPDRLYLDDYRPDGRDAVEQLCHQQLFLDRRAADRVGPWAWDLPTGSRPRTGAGTDPGDLVARVGRAGHDVIVVDLTTPEAAARGTTVVRVVVPGTVGTAPAAYPPLGRGRLQDSAVRLGWREYPLAEGSLNTFPIPHS